MLGCAAMCTYRLLQLALILLTFAGGAMLMLMLVLAWIVAVTNQDDAVLADRFKDDEELAERVGGEG
jgi:hypothetical protein